MTLPYTDIQSLTPTAILELFVLDATALGGSILYFHAGTNQLGTAVVWQGVTYTPFPIQASGFEWSSEGKLPRPKLTCSNLDGVVGALIRDLDDLVGAKVTLKRCAARHLDAVNFTGGTNPYGTPDPTKCWDDEPWIIERKTVETSDVIEFELITPLDQQSAQIPKRRITANSCPWAYKGTECGYAGALTSCAKTLADCKTHFGATAELPFGSFPGCARVK